MEIEGKFVKFTGIGVYLEDKSIPLLAVKWKGKTVDELTNSVEFYRDIVTGNNPQLLFCLWFSFALLMLYQQSDVLVLRIINLLLVCIFWILNGASIIDGE